MPGRMAFSRMPTSDATARPLRLMLTPNTLNAMAPALENAMPSDSDIISAAIITLRLLVKST